MNPNNQVHWNYSRTNSSWIPGTSTTTTISSSPVTSIKRSLSESDDCDTYSEGSSKEQCSSTAPSESCQMLTRKKRRGIIEKKRRDRINTSLTELKRLVPSAYEKQGSAKLEKAEILQMTVDYLKILNAKGVNNLAHDSHKYAIDYHSIGFRECTNEVSRYLVTMEGMDLQDPLRLRLISHLQCFATQREIANKQNTLSSPSTNPWSYSSTHQPVTQPYHHTLTTPPNLNQLSNPTSSTQMPSINVHDSGHNYLDISASCTFTLNAPDVLNKARHGQISHNNANNNNNTNNNNAYSFMLTPNLTPLTPVTTSSYSPHFNPYPTNVTNSNSSANANYSNQTTNASQMKPYRPWGGTELAY